MKACPKCKSPSRDRIRRKPILKLIPGTKAYSCNVCDTRYTYFYFVNQSFRV